MVPISFTLLALAPGVGAGGEETSAVAQGPAAESSGGHLEELADSKQVWGAERGGYRFVKSQVAPAADGD